MLASDMGRVLIQVKTTLSSAAHGLNSEGSAPHERAKKLMKIKAEVQVVPDHIQMGWQSISTAPFDRALELAVIDAQGPHTLVFPCRRVLHGWLKAATNEPVNVYPTHWREWSPAF
jgi:hypothetical protein